MKHLRTALAVVVALSGSVLALTHLGANPVAPGKDLGISVSVMNPPDGLVLRTDSGDLTTFVRLTIRPADDHVFTAALENGTAVGVTSVVNPDGRMLYLHKHNGGSTEKFDWPSGVALRVTRTSAATTATPITVVNWEVFNKDTESDAQGKARRRAIWGWTSTILLLVSAVGAVVATLASKEDKRRTHDAKACVEDLIEEIQGENPQQTQHIRTYLRKRVLEKASYDEAVRALGLKFARARAVSVKAEMYFSDRLGTLTGDLITIADQLKPKPGAAPAPPAAPPPPATPPPGSTPPPPTTP